MINDRTLTASIIGKGSITGSVSNQTELEGCTIVNDSPPQGSIADECSITGNITGQTEVEGKMAIGGAPPQAAILYVNQELTAEQREQARKNVQCPILGNLLEISGIVIVSPNGTRRLLTIEDNGALSSMIL